METSGVINTVKQRGLGEGKSMLRSMPAQHTAIVIQAISEQ